MRTNRCRALRPFLIANAGVCLAVLAAVGGTRPALASWPHHPKLNLPVCTAVNEQSQPTITSDGSGGAIIAWRDKRGGVRFDAYAQHILASGKADPVWPASGRVLCDAAGGVAEPATVSDGAGGAIVAWQDTRGIGSHSIYAQHVLASGVVDPAWPANGRAVCAVVGDKQHPVIVSDGTGGAIIAWQDEHSISPSGYDIYAMRVLASGALDPAWPPDGRALSAASGAQVNASIASDNAGGAIVAWQDVRGENAIYAQRVLVSGALDPAWPTNGRGICVVIGRQAFPVVVSDGNDGAIVAWEDSRSGTRVYAQHVLGSGVADPAWPADGRVLCTATGPQTFPSIAPDGAGGGIVTWVDYRSSGWNPDIYAQHVLHSGSVDPSWPVDGRALCVDAERQDDPRIVSDGAGGAIVTWNSLRSVIDVDVDVYAQHVLGSGVVDPAWPTGGRALCTAAESQSDQTIASDGAGGAIVTWVDLRNGQPPDIYAQWVGPTGSLSRLEPAIADVRDVPADQGGRALLLWSASVGDGASYPTIESYDIWRKLDASAELAARSRFTSTSNTDAAPQSFEKGAVRAVGTGALATYWEFVANVRANRHAGYAYTVPTTADSLPGFTPWNTFEVVARDTVETYANRFHHSAADSGYSVDNLAPATPVPFTLANVGGNVALHWGASSESDFAVYRLHRGASAGFVPGPGNQVAQQPDTGHVDTGGIGAYYKLAAVDVHGNVGGYASAHSPDATEVGEQGLPVDLAFAPAQPNPAARSTMLRFALPRETRVSLAVFDAAGRRVRTLVDGIQPAGHHALRWDLTDDSGRPMGAGLHFVQLAADGRRMVQRIVTLR